MDLISIYVNNGYERISLIGLRLRLGGMLSHGPDPIEYNKWFIF